MGTAAVPWLNALPLPPCLELGRGLSLEGPACPPAGAAPQHDLLPLPRSGVSVTGPAPDSSAERTRLCVPLLASLLALWKLKVHSQNPKMAIEGAPSCSPAVAGEAGREQWFSQIGALRPRQARVWA